MSTSSIPLVTLTWPAAGVAVATIDNPPMNLVSRAALRDLSACLARLAAESEVRALVVAGAR